MSQKTLLRGVLGKPFGISLESIRREPGKRPRDLSGERLGFRDGE